MANIFQKIFGVKSLLKTTVTESDVIKDFPNNQSNSKMSESYTSMDVSELLKQATALKKTDIEKSILLIEQAIKIRPDYSTYDKLTSYLIIAGNG